MQNELNTQNWGLHWFRRDLRITGNPALRTNWKKNKERVLGFFCFDSQFLSRADFSKHRFAFFIRTLEALKEEMKQQGGDLLVLDAPPQQAFQKLFEKLKEREICIPSLVTWNRDYEPFARDRDKRMTDFFNAQRGIQVETERDHLIFEPWEIINSELKPYYSIYSPFAKKWFEKLASSEGQKRLQDAKLPMISSKQIFRLTWNDLLGSWAQESDALESTRKSVFKSEIVSLPSAGTASAIQQLEQFKKSSLQDYQINRDFPSIEGTSRLSIFFKNGSFTSAQALQHLQLQAQAFQEKSSQTHFVKEIVWREFYYHILWHCPWVENRTFQSKFENLNWENNVDWFELWKAGQTGVPIVDAAMRELNETGWMHNRSRMIVASFLTKDLLIDWKWGERYFMERLLDGDLAPNNGGWQWAASTGCDPQPYFRIFNPYLQSEKFDPNGSYIAKFVPELGHLKGKKGIHRPSETERGAYPAPIVDHAAQRQKALALYGDNG